MPSQTLAVIDIGSNTSRVTVFRMNGGGHYEPVAESRASLRLLRGFGSDSRSEAETTASLLAALKDFKAVATGAGADRIVAVATYSVRRYSKAKQLVRQIEHEIGIEVQVVDGPREAELCYLGGVYGLDVEDGMLIDLGGGSLELAQFRDRALVRSWSLPLGALLLSDRHLRRDPPTKSQLEALQSDVAEAFVAEGIGPLKERERLIGTGGTVRNLARIDRLKRHYPIPQLHGYVFNRQKLKELSRQLSTLPRAKLADQPGLNADRSDSIAGGVLILHAAMRLLKAKTIEISGQGLREGFALSTSMTRLPPPETVRKAAIETLARRFACWNEPAAERRVALAALLHDTLEPDAGGSLRECLLHAAWVVDIGKSIDYVDRFVHTVAILLATDLAGFSHRHIALLAGIISAADRRKFDWRAYRPLLSGEDDRTVRRAGMMLALADEVERRLPPGTGTPPVLRDGRRVTIRLDLPAPAGGRLSALAARSSDAFGWELRFQGKE